MGLPRLAWLLIGVFSLGGTGSVVGRCWACGLGDAGNRKKEEGKLVRCLVLIQLTKYVGGFQEAEYRFVGGPVQRLQNDVWVEGIVDQLVVIWWICAYV